VCFGALRLSCAYGLSCAFFTSKARLSVWCLLCGVFCEHFNVHVL
jgi:hypothetical protein